MANVQECWLARFARYYITAASPLHYAVSSIDGSSHSRLYGPHPFLCRNNYYARVWTRHYYVNIMFPSHYAVSIINCSSQNCLCDPFTEAVTFYGGSRTSCSQNSLVGFFNVDFDFFAFVRTHDLGLQVKLFMGFFSP